MLYDASLVNAMIADVERIDINSISSQAFHSCSSTASEDEDIQLNAECMHLVSRLIAYVTDSLVLAKLTSSHY